MNAATSAHLLALPDASMHTPAHAERAQTIDLDPQETQEWRDAFTALVAAQGPERARQILDGLVALSRHSCVSSAGSPS
jgi:pyruvate dehydrogenase E1 component